MHMYVLTERNELAFWFMTLKCAIIYTAYIYILQRHMVSQSDWPVDMDVRLHSLVLQL